MHIKSRVKMTSAVLVAAPLALFLLGCGRDMPVAADSSRLPDQLSIVPPAPARTVRVPAGTRVKVRLAEDLDSPRDGSGIEATLVSPLAIAGETVLPAGTRFTGRVTGSGASPLAVTLDSFVLGGRTYRISTNSLNQILPDETLLGFVLSAPVEVPLRRAQISLTTL